MARKTNKESTEQTLARWEAGARHDITCEQIEEMGWEAGQGNPGIDYPNERIEKVMLCDLRNGEGQEGYVLVILSNDGGLRGYQLMQAKTGARRLTPV